MVVHGNDGLDEVTTTDKTFISEFNGKEVFSYEMSPEELLIGMAKPADLKGGSLEDNVRICEAVLNGEEGPKRDIVVLNAAYALYIAGKSKSVPQGMDVAIEMIDSGEANKKLQELKAFTQKCCTR